MRTFRLIAFAVFAANVRCRISAASFGPPRLRTRDTSFGVGGLAKVNVKAAGNLEEARGVVVQSDGRIVIGGTVEK